MKIMISRKSIFLKLIFSYIILIIVITLILGLTAYFYSSTSYNNEVKKLNNELIEQYKKIIEDNIIIKAEKLYLQLITAITKNFDLDSMFRSNMEDIAAINSLNIYLKTITVSNTDILDAVHIYFCKPKTLISSRAGLKYLNDASAEIPSGMDWITNFYQLNEKAFWYETKQLYVSADHSTSVFTFVKAYPYSNPSGTSNGYIALDLKEDALKAIIHNAHQKHPGDMFIVDGKGNIITHNNAESIAKNLLGEKYILDIVKSPLKSFDYVDTVNGITSMISYTTLVSSNWRLVRITPINEFYHTSHTLQKTLIILCLLAIFTGILLALIFSNYLYNPVKLIVYLVQSLFKNSSVPLVKSQNEYTIINNAIHSLSGQVDLLQKHLQSNKPLIKHTIITRLLHGKFNNMEELEQHLNLINVSFCEDNYNVIIFKPDDNVLEELETKNMQLYKYDLISQIENRSSNDFTYISSELPDDEIVVVVCSRNTQLSNIYKHILSYAYEFYRIRLNVSVGTWVTNAIDLPTSYKHAKISFQYKYLLPSSNIFISDQLMEREYSNHVLSDDFFIRFSKAIRAVDIESAEKCFKEFTQELVGGKYSYQYCNTKMLEMVSILSIYVKELNYDSNDIYHGGIFSMHQDIPSIREYERWFMEILKKTLEYIAIKNDIKVDNVINTAKIFIQQNLDKDLSLESVADAIFLSPSYFSRTFKKYTHMSYTDFLTHQRLEKAKHLLENTSLKVEDIAKKTGFNTPHYFTKKFREAFGITPLKFKRKNLTDTDYM